MATFRSVDYGAVGDGSAIDRAALRSMFSALMAASRSVRHRVVILPGAYKVDGDGSAGQLVIASDPAGAPLRFDLVMDGATIFVTESGARAITAPATDADLWSILRLFGALGDSTIKGGTFKALNRNPTTMGEVVGIWMDGASESGIRNLSLIDQQFDGGLARGYYGQGIDGLRIVRPRFRNPGGRRNATYIYGRPAVGGFFYDSPSTGPVANVTIIDADWQGYHANAIEPGDTAAMDGCWHFPAGCRGLTITGGFYCRSGFEVCANLAWCSSTAPVVIGGRGMVIDAAIPVGTSDLDGGTVTVTYALRLDGNNITILDDLEIRNATNGILCSTYSTTEQSSDGTQVGIYIGSPTIRMAKPQGTSGWSAIYIAGNPSRRTSAVRIESPIIEIPPGSVLPADRSLVFIAHCDGYTETGIRFQGAPPTAAGHTWAGTRLQGVTSVDARGQHWRSLMPGGGYRVEAAGGAVVTTTGTIADVGGPAGLAVVTSGSSVSGLTVGSASVVSGTPAWPAGVPGPLAAGYDRTAAPSGLRSEMDSGQARQRRRWSQVPRTFSVNWSLTDSQAAELDVFGREDLAGWTGWFSLSLPSPADPTGSTPTTVRFTGPPKTARPTPGRWSYTATLESEPTP